MEHMFVCLYVKNQVLMRLLSCVVETYRTSFIFCGFVNWLRYEPKMFLSGLEDYAYFCYLVVIEST